MEQPAAANNPARSPTRRAWLGMVAAFLVLGIGLAVTCFGSWSASRLLHKRASETFQWRAQQLAAEVDKVLQIYLHALGGFQGMEAASQSVEPGEFTAFYRSMNLETRYPGFVSVQLARRVHQADKIWFVDSMRKLLAVQYPGAVAFEVAPSGDRSEYAPVIYAEPGAAAQKFLGYDLASEPARLEALQRARDENRPAATAQLQLSEGQTGFVIMLPLYAHDKPHDTVEQRREAWSGAVAGAFSAHMLFEEVCRWVNLEREVDLEVFETPALAEQSHDPELIFARMSDGRRPRRLGNEFRQAIGIPFAGRAWTLSFSAPLSYSLTKVERFWPVVIFWAGLLLSVLLYFMCRMLAMGQSRAERLAMKMTGELRQLLQDLQTAKQRIETQADELLTANKKLKDTSLLKDEFIAKVSHELRTPLTSIKEGMSLLMDNALGETTAEQQDFLSTMNHDLDRLTELINNMLDLSKIEAGRMRLRRQRVDLSTLVHRLLQSNQTLVGHRTIRTEGASVPPAFADPNSVLQILTNLFSNAIKFTPEDGAITLRLAQRNGFVTVAVEDTGPGISAEDLTRLFQKFSQVGEQNPNRPRGTGLGLVVCKELAELHKGRVEVTSEEGHGTTFTLLLPVSSEAFALQESFQELSDLIAVEPERDIALLALNAHTLLDEEPNDEAREKRLLQAAEDVRRHLHAGDLVLTLPPCWVVVFAAADSAGARAIVRRLRSTLRDGALLQFGVAVYPTDAAEPMALYGKATQTLDQGLALPEETGQAAPMQEPAS